MTLMTDMTLIWKGRYDINDRLYIYGKFNIFSILYKGLLKLRQKRVRKN